MLCSKSFKQITASHMRSHNMTLEAYMVQFPDAELVSNEIKEKIASKNKGKTKSEEHLQKIRDGIKRGFEKGRVVHNKGQRGVVKDKPETRESKRQAHLGKKHSDETKAKIGKAHKGKIISEDTIQRQRATLLETVKQNGGGFATGERSNEFKIKMSEMARKRFENMSEKERDEHAKLARVAALGSKRTEKQKENHRSARVKFMIENPDKLGMKLFDTKPELEFEQELIKRKLQYVKQYHTSNPHYLYDFLIENKYIVEIDGPYHYMKKLHSSLEEFEKRLITDAIKNLTAGKHGFKICRIKVDSHLPNNWEEILHQQGLDINYIK